MQQRTYLISGASKGIGLALAHRLQRAGHQVVGWRAAPTPASAASWSASIWMK